METSIKILYHKLLRLISNIADARIIQFFHCIFGTTLRTVITNLTYPILVGLGLKTAQGPL